MFFFDGENMSFDGSLVIHRVIQEEFARLRKMIVCVILSKKSSYEHGSDFERLRIYDRLKLRIEGKDY